MESVIKAIGAFVLAAGIMSVPILTTLSFVYAFPEGVQFLLTSMTLILFVGLAGMIWEVSE